MKWRDSQPPCEVSADPLAEARSTTLQIAKAAAQRQKAKLAKKKAPRPAQAEGGEKETPPAKRQQLGGEPPDLSL